MCDDGNPCTTEGCDPATGCTHTLRNGSDVPECDDGDPCTDPTCNAVSGCQQVPKTLFASVDCRLGDLAALVNDPGADEQARGVLGDLVAGAQAKIDGAEQANMDGRVKKTKSGLKGARKKLLRFGKKVAKFEPAHITDPDLAAMLSNKSFDATTRIDALRAELGL
jgi:hypothetical protein